MSGMTVAEKIFSRVAGRVARAGDFVWTAPDLVYIHDVLGPLVLDSLSKMGVSRPAFKGKIVFVFDHIFPPKDSASANNILSMKRFASGLDIDIIREGEGIEHTLLIENGRIVPGMFAVGSDSHTVTAGGVGAIGVGMGSTDIAALMAMGVNWFRVPETMRIKLSGEFRKFVSGKDVILEVLRVTGPDGANYKSMEFSGSAMPHIDIDKRLAIANMTVECGAKCGVIVPDNVVERYFRSIGVEPDIVTPDDDARYESEINVDLLELTPKIAAPYSPANVHDISEFVGTKIDQAYLGNCANGTIGDLREAAEILKGRQVAEGTRLIIIPATRRIYQQAMSEGLLRIFSDAGAVIGPPTCGACAGLHFGVLGKGETAITNTNRNFRGRMGDPESQVFLGNSYVVAAAALEGKITNPEEAI
ncbi:MAG: aconitase/3-isopropylmalate dehydratase large subunit family protein [Thermoplasmataceae archaeon]